MVVPTAQLHSIKPKLRSCTGSNPARKTPAGNKAKGLSSVNYSAKAIHHHHHHHQIYVLHFQEQILFIFVAYFLEKYKTCFSENFSKLFLGYFWLFECTYCVLGPQK